jgi:hypothetical protein
MEPIAVEQGRILYTSPILLNDEPYTLNVGYYNGEYEILSAVKKSETRLASKTQRKLVPGDVVQPIHFAVPVHDDGSRTIEEMPMGMATVDENTSFYTRGLGEGYFKLTFQMIDYAGKTYYSNECSFRVRNGVVERLPDGIVATAVRPDNSIEAHYISTETWRHEAWNEDIEFYYAVVDGETYTDLANTVGTNPNYDSTTGTVTIHLISDTLNLQDYVGVRMAYMTGTAYAAESVFERRDIVFKVESITEVW